MGWMTNYDRLKWPGKLAMWCFFAFATICHPSMIVESIKAAREERKLRKQ